MKPGALHSAFSLCLSKPFPKEIMYNKTIPSPLVNLYLRPIFQ